MGTWVHLAGVYDGTNWILYRNGEQLASLTDSTGAVVVGGDWALGARGDGSERFFDGMIDDARVYNYASAHQETALDNYF